ncbi:MAG: preprotein translocase subunit SecG [Bacteroidetes bacterium]|nr:preprotein translocase subunit SecG [Bacteroidota bacterium]
MYIFLIVLIIIASLLLILAVLSQHPKGGMAANFGASNQVMGVRQTSDFLERFTWGTAIFIVVVAVAATMFMPSKNIEASKSLIEQNIQRETENVVDVQPADNVEIPALEGTTEEAK